MVETMRDVGRMRMVDQSLDQTSGADGSWRVRFIYGVVNPLNKSATRVDFRGRVVAR